MMSPGDEGEVQPGVPPIAPRQVIQPPRQGDQLGRFVLEQPLGHGAMATVFRARDSGLGRLVAIKVLNPAVASQTSSAERFRREAMAVAALRHPNIVEVYDFVPAANGHSAYLVQELIGGETIQELLEARGRPLIPEVAALLAADVAEALAAAHGRGVVHRDVKPANIMLERQAAGARVVLTDFGVAHVGELTTMTATGAMVGSPAYMSPEQARGLPVGPQVDVWALGILLYQLTTAKLPFAGRDPITVITAICKGEFRRAGQIDARVGPELDRIIVGCLRISASERFASAAEVAKLLRDCAARVGLQTSSPVLRRLLDAPQALEDELKPKLAEHAVANARTFMRKRQLARALAELGRATAYVPKHSEALKLIDALSAQRRWGRVLFAAAAVFVVLGVGTTAYRSWKTRAQKPAPAPNAANVATPQPKPASQGPAAPVTVETPPPELAHAQPPSGKPAKRPSKIPPKAAAAPPAASETAVPDSIVPDSPAAPAPVLAQAPAEAPAHVRLFARFAFCFPSLDDDDVRKAPPRSYTVAAGPHQVYCALTREGPRLRAGTLQVRAGTRMDVNIVPNAQGKPTLSGNEPAR